MKIGFQWRLMVGSNIFVEAVLPLGGVTKAAFFEGVTHSQSNTRSYLPFGQLYSSFTHI
jgi:hypothetical protein